LVGLILSSVVLAIILIVRGTGPAPAPTTVAVPPSPVAPGPSPISPPTIPEGGPILIVPRPEQVRAGAPIIVEGEAPPGTRVRVYDGEILLGETESDATGRWRLEVGRTWSEGRHELKAVGLDEQGREIGASEPIVVVLPPPSPRRATPVAEASPTPERAVELPAVTPVPTVPVSGLPEGPARPSLKMHVSIESPRPGAKVVEDLAQVSGEAPTGALVRVYDVQRLVGQTTAQPDGEWRLATQGKFPAGDHLIWAEALASDGTLLGLSRSVFFTVVAGQAGKAPSLKIPVAGAALKEARPTLEGTGEPGAIVRIYADTRPIAEAAVDREGRWRARPNEPLPPGRHIIRAVVVDEEGRPLAESEPVDIVVAQPAEVLPLTGGERPDP
jgi:hypothetical protein